MPDHEDLIARTAQFVRSRLTGAEGGHDWQHTQRVWRNARLILGEEEADGLVVELAALLHDIADAKFHNGDEEIGPALARQWLEKQPELSPERRTHVEQIVRHISYKGGHNQEGFYSIELGIVRDADRLDAIGAIGIARAFSYGGHKGRALHDPDIPPNLHLSREAYKQSTAPTLNHFYEKLLRLRDLMHTERGRQLAVERHQFMEQYLEQFLKEWDGLC